MAGLELGGAYALRCGVGLVFPTEDDTFDFCRFIQVGLLRLLATSAIMGDDVRTIGEAWIVYDRWLEDVRIGIRPESFDIEAAFRAAARSVSRLSSAKALGNCYLVAVSQVTGATLATFDRGLAAACNKVRQPVRLLETAPADKR